MFQCYPEFWDFLILLKGLNMNLSLIAFILPLFLFLSFQLKGEEIDKWYLGALYSFQEVSLKPLSAPDEREYQAAGVIGGYKFNGYIAIESRVNFGVSDYSVHVPRGDQSAVAQYHQEKIKMQTSLSIILSYPITNAFDVYLLTGYTMTDYDFLDEWEIEGPYAKQKNSKNFNGINYGIGSKFNINTSFTIIADYQVLHNFKPYGRSFDWCDVCKGDWQSFNLGLVYNF